MTWLSISFFGFNLLGLVLRLNNIPFHLLKMENIQLTKDNQGWEREEREMSSCGVNGKEIKKKVLGAIVF